MYVYSYSFTLEIAMPVSRYVTNRVFKSNFRVTHFQYENSCKGLAQLNIDALMPKYLRYITIQISKFLYQRI